MVCVFERGARIAEPAPAILDPRQADTVVACPAVGSTTGAADARVIDDGGREQRQWHEPYVLGRRRRLSAPPDCGDSDDREDYTDVGYPAREQIEPGDPCFER